MRCGSDTESVLLLLISTEAWGGQAAGLRASDKRLRDDGRGKEGPFSVFLGHE